MITLYACGPGFGLPEISPYVTKTEIQLRMAGLSYDKVQGRREDSPKGQLPYIQDAGEWIADSTFIRGHIEAKYEVDLDAGLGPVERAQAWAIERMLENQLAWVSGYFRFMVAENFDKGPARWFDQAPEAMRATLREGLLDAVGANLRSVGVLRHDEDEILSLGLRSLGALSLMLGDKAFVMGDRPTSVDAVAFGVVAGILTPFFTSPLRDAAETLPNLVAYADRMLMRFYPQYAWTLADAA
jgi:glutathione S-transferase